MLSGRVWLTRQTGQKSSTAVQVIGGGKYDQVSSFTWAFKCSVSAAPHQKYYSFALFLVQLVKNYGQTLKFECSSIFSTLSPESVSQAKIYLSSNVLSEK